MKLFQKDSLIVSKVETETSVTKVISRQFKCYVLKWKILIFWAIRNSFWLDPLPRVTVFFLVVMLNLTSFWVRDNCISLYERIIRWVVNDHALWRTLSVCRILLWCLLHIMISVNVSPGHQRDRKKVRKNSISVCKTLLVSLTSTIVFSIINKLIECHLTVNCSFLS